MLIVQPHFHPRRTGVTAHVEQVSRALAPLAEVRVLGRQLPEELPRITARELLRRARDEVVVWHAHRNNELLWGLALQALRPGVALVGTVHGSRRPGRFSRLLLARAQAVVTLNRLVQAALGLPSRVVQHGVDVDRFAPPEDRPRAFAALGLPGKRALGVVGRVRPGKGQGDFAAALAPLLPAHPEWTPVLVGLVKEPERRWAQGLVEATAGRLVLAGEQRRVAPWYQGLSVVVHPSHAEAFSLVLLEAMAAGCCVVATRIAAVPEVVEDGVTGFLYEPGDVPALRALLARLLASPDEVARVGAAARQAVVARHALAAEARALVALYAEAAAQRR